MRWAFRSSRANRSSAPMTLYAETPFTESQSRLVQVIAPHLAQAVWAAKRNGSGGAGSSHAQPPSGEFRHAARLDALRHSRSDHLRPPTFLSISPRRHFSTFRKFLREFSDSSPGVYLALRFSDARARDSGASRTRGDTMGIELWLGVTAVLLMMFGGASPAAERSGAARPCCPRTSSCRAISNL